MKSLTSEQDRVLSFIIEHKEQTGVPPTVREISFALGYKSINNARQHLRLIEQKGYIRLARGKARGIDLLIDTGKENGHNELEVPLIGAVAAGAPITAEENVEGHVTLDRTLFRGKDLFTLRIEGDSMKEIGVLDGDIVVVRQQTSAQNGEVVVAIIDGDATLKRYIQKSDHVILRAENPEYRDIVIPADRRVYVVGKLVGVIRKY